VVRSADFKTRVRVTLGKAPEDGSGNPYQIEIWNLASGDRGGDEPIELNHSGSGYIWIDGGMMVAHYTDVLHPFVIRNANKEPVFTITLNPAVNEL
jgi:hypothetical protein